MGMDAGEVTRMADSTGFSTGVFPFRYLGVPICTPKLRAADCEKLVEKMVFKIRTWSTRNLSFARRVQLINSVLISVHSYWAQIFLLPKADLQKIISICRSFLRKGDANNNTPGYVSSDRVCTSKKYGGIGDLVLEMSYCGIKLQ